MKNDKKYSADITRREALKKIGKYGLYVPPTLAVLSAAPRAFAQSCLATLTGTVSEVDGGPIQGALVQVHCSPTLSTTTNSLGEYTVPNIPPGLWKTEWDVPGDHAEEMILYEECEVVTRDKDL